MRDCGLPTTSRFCTEHNVDRCSCCMKSDDACDHGGCHDTATATVRALATRTGALVEVRRMCARHVAVAVAFTDGGRYSYEIRR